MEEAVAFVMITSQLEEMAVIRMVLVAPAVALMRPVAEEHPHLVARLVSAVLMRVLSDWVDPCVGTTEVAGVEDGMEVGLLMQLVVEVVPATLRAHWYLTV